MQLSFQEPLCGLLFEEVLFDGFLSTGVLYFFLRQPKTHVCIMREGDLIKNMEMRGAPASSMHYYARGVTVFGMNHAWMENCGLRRDDISTRVELFPCRINGYGKLHG